jgi:tetratricopeptide (TPR) repeat protein
MALVVAVAWSAFPVHADPSKPPVVDHYELGKRWFERKSYAQALEEFHLALSIAPRPEVLYSMAQAQRMLGDCASAIETYRAFLAGRPGEPLGEYARANIQRCEQDGAGAGRSRRVAWYGDLVGDVLVGSGIVAGVTGMVVWHDGRSTAMNVAGAPDYQTFLRRQAAASSALTEQRLGVAAMIVGGAALLGGVVHYVHHARASHREVSLGVAPTAGGAMIGGRGTF